MLKRVRLGNITAYQDERFIPQLRAWVDDGNGYELTEILNTDTTWAYVLNLGDEEHKAYFVKHSEIHCIHTYNPHYNSVVIHGEPR